MSNPLCSLASLLANAEVFVDGDWVESKDQDPAGDVRLIQLADVGDGVYVDKSNRFLTSETAQRLKCTYLRPGDILIARMPDPIGRACIFPGDPKTSVTVVDVCIIRVDERSVCARWLMHALNSSLARRQIEGFVSGTTRSRISRGNLGKIELRVPAIDEQRRIAAILDKADALRAKRREALAQLDRLAQSIFVEMFGDPLNNPKGWRKHRLRDVFDITRGGSPRPIDDYITDAADGVNWVMIGDTQEGGKYIHSTKKKIRPEGVKRSRVVKSGDFLLTNSMSFGRPYIMRTSGCIHDGWLALSPQTADFDADYFYALLSSKVVFAEFSRRAAGATVKNLNIDIVSSVEVAVPPLEHQRRFSGVIGTIERIQAAQELSNAHLEGLFNSLQSRAFRGAL